MDDEDEYDELEQRSRETPAWLKGFSAPAAIGTAIFAIALGFGQDQGFRPDNLATTIIVAFVFGTIAGFLDKIIRSVRARRLARRQAKHRPDRGEP